MPSCYRPSYERGASYELYCIRRTIAGLESRGEDATFERELYNSWIKIPEYKKADKENRGRGLYGVLLSVGNPSDSVSKVADGVNYGVSAKNADLTSDNGSSFETSKKHPGGRPKKSGDNVSRSTTWRREKEKAEQGVLV